MIWDELTITKESEVELNQIGRRSKYRHIYARIERELTADDWLVISDIGTIRESESLKQAIRRKFPDIEIHGRKYNEKGFDHPQIYLRLVEG